MKKAIKAPIHGVKEAKKASLSRLVEQAKGAWLLNQEVYGCSTKRPMVEQPRL